MFSQQAYCDVKTECLLLALRLNINKLHNRKLSGRLQQAFFSYFQSAQTYKTVRLSSSLAFACPEYDLTACRPAFSP